MSRFSECGPDFPKVPSPVNPGQMSASLWAHRFASLLFLTVCTLAMGIICSQKPAPDSNDSFNVPVAPIWPLASAYEGLNANRKIYPYSVVPGGVETPQELREAIHSDEVVAEHYADFDTSRARPVVLQASQLMYVSYRIGRNIYWTKGRLALAKGELMLTDGRNMIRGRCGNRVSAMPIRPNALAEPSAEVFDAPIVPPETSTPYLAASSMAPPAAAAPPSSTSPGGPGGPTSSFVPVGPFFPPVAGGGLHPRSTTPGGGGSPPPGGGGSTPPPGGGGSTPPPGGGGGTPPPVGIPEPGTGTLLLVGVAALCVFLLARKAC